MHKNIFHFCPEKNWINDPNGLVYYKGEYHLFYQHNPYDTVWGPMHWGHAVSADLLNWEHLPIALYPDDIGAIFSGSAVVDWNDSSGFFNGNSGLVAIFTHHSDEKEVQSIAYSFDNGRSWIKFKGNPVIENPGKKDFRDPKVFFHQPSRKWIAIIACGSSVMFYSSGNLRTWNFESEFTEESALFEGPWECPDLFQLSIDDNKNDRKWILKIDVGNGAYAGGSGGMYFTGEFDGKTFINDNPGGKNKWLDYCQDFYAAQTWHGTLEEQKRLIWIGWMNNWQYANKIPAVNFRGMMSTPRELKLKRVSDEIFLVQKPVEEAIRLWGKAIRENNLSIGKNKPYHMDYRVKALEMIIEATYERSLKFNITVSFGNNEAVLITIDGQSNKIVLDRSASGKSDFSSFYKGKFEAELPMIKECIKIDLFIDINSIEVFINEGLICMSSLIFPKEHIKSIDISPFDDYIELRSLDIYSLN